MKFVEGFKINFDDKNILQLLSRNKPKTENKKPNLKLLTEINQLKEVARKLIYPKAIHATYQSEDLEPRFLFKKSEKTVFAICTIGIQLENESEKSLKDGLLSRGVILDAIASSVTENIAEQTEQHIIKEIKDKKSKLEITNRFSPGYCQWSLEEGQNLIFSRLQGDSVGVTLTESKMMIPRKSISFAMNIGNNVDKNLGLRECDTCDLLDCSFRR